MRAVMVNFNLMRLPKETIYRYSEIQNSVTDETNGKRVDINNN